MEPRLDDGDGEISLEEFEGGIMRMKGYARSFDLNKLDRQMQKMNAKVDLLLNSSGASVQQKSAKKLLVSPKLLSPAVPAVPRVSKGKEQA